MIRDQSISLSVLHVEDDEKIAQLTSSYLESYGVKVTVVPDGSSAVQEALRARSDLVLLDIVLPDIDGFEVCQRLRRHLDTPIIIVSGYDDEATRVAGFEAGADDYIAKPFSCRELLARIRAHTFRARGRVGPSGQPIVVGTLCVDPRAMQVKLDGRALGLTTYEFALLRAFAERAGEVLTRERLMELAKGNAEDSFDRSIDVHVSRLRQKLGDDPRSPRLLKTVRGVGYLLATA